MSVRIVRMQNGEDVIADVKEVREPEANNPVAYKLDYPYALTIRSPQTMLFEDGSADMQMDKLDIEFQAYVPLSKNSYIFLPIPSVAMIYEPNDELVEQYTQLVSQNGKDLDSEE